MCTVETQVDQWMPQELANISVLNVCILNVFVEVVALAVQNTNKQ